MKYLVLYPLLTLTMALITPGCKASGVPQPTENYSVSKTVVIKGIFSGISVESGIKLAYYISKSEQKAVIKGPKDLVDGIKWEIDRDGILHWRIEGNVKMYSTSGGSVSVQLTGPSLSDWRASQGSTLVVADKVNSKQPLKISSSSGAKISFLEASTGGSLSLIASSSGTISSSEEIKFKNTAEISASSGGRIILPSLQGNDAEITASSASDIAILSSQLKKLGLSASSAGDIKASGMKCTSLTALSSSGSDLIIEGHIDRAILKSASGGFIRVMGRATTVDVKALSASKIDISQLKTESRSCYSSSAALIIQ